MKQYNRPTGWRNDSFRHGLSAKGIKTGRFVKMLPFSVATNRLPVQVSVIVPSTLNNKKIPVAEFNKRVRDEKTWFSKKFGGDTSIRDVGSYWDGKKLVTEPGVVVESSMSVDSYNKFARDMAQHFEDVQKSWGQDTVLVKVEGQAIIIPKKDYIDTDTKAGDDIQVT